MTVLQEVQKGYSLKGRTIRPASVIVSKPAEGGE
jgi:molecular chaperone GrpE (heat shock protein)